MDKELFYLPEEQVSLIGPNLASVMINMVETSVSVFRSRFVDKYFDEAPYRFKEGLANQEYIVAVSDQIDTEFGEQHEKIKKELGSQWSDLQSYEH